jgi:hypothetical protein
MKPGIRIVKPDNRLPDESAVTNMIEYLMVTSVIMALFVVVLLLVNTNIMEDPANRLVYVAFTDIGNGVSTRIVDVYAIAPDNGTISTKFDIPDDIVGRDYFVEIGPVNNPVDEDVIVSRGLIEAKVMLACIGASRGVRGNTTGRGMNIITYNSGGM